MGYIQDLERELIEKFDDMSKEDLIKYFKDKVYESFRNGAKSFKPAKGKNLPTKANTHGQD